MKTEFEIAGSAGDDWLQRDSLPALIKVEQQVTAVRWLGILSVVPLGAILFHGRALQALAVICVVAALYNLLVQRYVIRRKPAWLTRGPLMVVFDIATTGAVIAFTGGLKSDLYLFYFLITIVAAVRFGRRAALLSLAVVTGTYTAVVLGVGAAPVIGTFGTILFRVVMLALTSVFAGFVVSRARQADRRLEHSYASTLSALSAALDQRDVETEDHSRRVAAYAIRLAREIGIGPDDELPLARGALLHDIGKIGVPDHILRKPGPLSRQEWEVMRQHPEMGRRILQGVPALADALPVVIHHHERWDGSGYPSGLRGERIELLARIFALVDAYDAMTADRPYRAAMSHDDAVAELLGGSGTQFDPKLVDIFVSIPTEEWELAAASAQSRSTETVTTKPTVTV